MRSTTASPMECKRTISDADSTSSTSRSSHLSSECQSDYDILVAPEYYSLEVSHIEMHNIPKVGWISLDDRFWLQIIADGKTQETSVAGRGSLCWPDKFTFNVRKSSKLSFRLYARRYVHENKFIGEVGKCVEDFKVVTCPDYVVLRDWYNPEHNDDLKHTTVMCGIAKRVLSAEEAAEAATTQQLRVSNIIVHDLPRVKLISLDDHFFVQIEVDGKVACITDVQRGHSLRWKNEYPCDYKKDSRIQLKVFAHRHVHKDHLVCVISDDVESLLRDGSVRRHLSDFDQSGKKHEIPAIMEFQITCPTSTITDSLQDPDVISVPNGGIADAISPTTTSVEISDIRLVHLPKTGMFAFNDQLFVQLVVGSESQTTSQKAQKNESICWDEKYTFYAPETAVLSLQVYSRRPNDEYLGMIRNHIGAFLQGSGCFDEQLIIFDKESGRNLKIRLSFRIRQISSSYERSKGSARSLSTQSKDRSPPQHAGDTPVTVEARPSTAPSRVMEVQAVTPPTSVQTGRIVVGDIADTLKPLLSRIDIFVQIGRAFAEAHPYTKMAFMILTAGYEVIRQQHARDESIRKLASTMCDSYSLVSDATYLCRFQDQEKTVTLLARQTIECAYFIRGYALHKSGLKHAISNVFSNIDTTILGYETAFGNIKAALEQKVVINTQLVVFHIHDALRDLAARVDLNQLPYATGASYHAQRSHYENMSVEEDLLTEISDWVNDQSSPAIYLLIGPDGSEASAVAHTVARRFDAISRLGSSYCLARDRRTQQQPTNLFSTIARDLADHDPEFMACLSDKVKRRALRSSPHIPTQFDFILAPAQQLTSFGPVLIVIDALDACGDANSRVDVLSVLKEKAQYLPPSFKFLITCLPDTDVDTALRDSTHVLSKELDSVVTKQLRDQRFTVAVGRTNPRPPTPPIKTVFPQPDYFSSSQSVSSVSNESCSSSSSTASSIFDKELSTFSPDSDISSPLSSCTDAGSPERFLAKVQYIKSQTESYSLDPDGQPNTVIHTHLRQTVKQHATSTPRRAPSLTPMLDEPNSHLFNADPTITAENTLSVVSQVGSPRARKKKNIPTRQETLIRSEMHTTGSLPITHLPS